ncbi:stage V sporulation protein D (sporulation-specific penicillin-binding protein)/penicillin-binding protein 2B [Marininema mesophilum]|uniref:Stage V sporulation protein D (Sporulation-specific penicillin-binding protein)/penicillin-binding protein 2B n=1 Tax=Marininema mesophilum TaxID=1048340 RepID=A0A1H2QH31_9BACL|nr:PASTA domain-containing penicillin-binding protein [Marininema mesophilum]SDW05749.1 stage V sporulation protein D (sporulation-specific penicillin-binding protein)/penicillin-binding protein 2B [Marininema mesophilum]
MNPTKKQRKIRSLFVGMGCVLLLAAVVFRLFWLQTVDASFLRERAQHIWEKKEVIKPKRGAIVDRNGNELVQEVKMYYIAADLKLIKSKRKTAEKLSPLLGIPEDDIYEKLNRKKVNQVELRKKGNYKISQKKRNKVMDLDLPGIYAIQTTGRKYIEGDLAAHVLGFVNMEGQPVGGLEQKYNRTLTGSPGKMSFAKDAKGYRVPNQAEKFRPADPGKNLTLTLDREIQQLMENQLDQVMARYQAKGATAIAADPKTGAILAMASRPNFDPNRFGDTWDSDTNTNIAVSSQFEPGSTFKIVTLAAAIEEKKFDEQKKFPSGYTEVEGRKLRDWNNVGWGKISFAEGINLSSNVAFIELGKQLGGDRLSRYIDRFGFGRITDRVGRPTGIDLPYEAKGIFYGYQPLRKLELATTAFGQGISVTPIQQVMAVSAVANGGKLYRPYIVDHIQDPVTGKKIKKINPFAVRKHVISPSSAAKVRKLLRDVVVKGTGKEADAPGYDIAGKTGTAQKVAQGGKGYDPDDYIVSFTGFAPANNPRVVVYVAVDEPQGDKHGGTVAAPAAREIIKGAINQLNGKSKKEPTGNISQKEVMAGKWKGKPVASLKKSLEKKKVRTYILGSEDKVIAQYPAPGDRIIRGGGTVYLVTEETKSLSMPDLRGKSLREAMDVSRLIGLKPKAEGEGFVIGQSIPPGDPILDNQHIQLKLKPPKWQ